MRSDYASAYEEIATVHWWWQARDALVLSRLRAWRANHGPFGPILDVGCGNGRLFGALREIGDPQGIEPDSAMVAENGPWRACIEITPLERASLPEGHFGLILLLDVLEHIEDDRGALMTLRRALRPDGLLALSVPALPALWSHHDTMNRHFRRYTARGLRSIVANGGYEIVSLEFAFAWSLPAMLARKMLGFLPGAARGMPRVPPQGVNRLCRALCRWENAATKWCRLPFGSSLVLLARCKAGLRKAEEK